ncbi:chromate transporter [Deinococcus cavernae]|nr:chromate transporter [Deinococcus cavernae]
MSSPDLLGAMFAEFARLGLVSFGGANLAEMERVLVLQRHWISPQVLANGFALGQVMPGPNLLAVTHYGYAIAGWSGAAVATAAFYGPTAFLSALVAALWYRNSRHPWAVALRNSLLPFGAGVMLASLLVLWRSSVHHWVGAALATLAFALLWKTRVNAALVIAAAALIGAVIGL